MLAKVSSSSASSNPISSSTAAAVGRLGYGYEYVGTVYLDQGSISWSAPCFKENSAILVLKNQWEHFFYYTVIVTPHYGQCWTCRDDYQFKLGDKNVKTGSTYFGGVGNDFVLSILTEEVDQLKNEGIHIYVDTNAACNGISRKTIKNPFEDVARIAMN
ncbi:unnamed protein product [Cuscuta campestris]|uniref:Uncharacterized protein n=1 Tax=Cuscuta campestris TaxID=132261 RepID=A0A484L710_9ASTE|nr:unnamed protein product [Cuscuta campestris]